MKKRCEGLLRHTFTAAATAAAMLALSVSAAAQGYSASVVSKPAPSELSAAVRAILEPQAIEVKGPSGVLCDIWLRKDIPGAATAPMELGVVYSQLTPGTLIGAMQLPAQAIDFRNQKIKPGVYTLRYELDPVDGNHQGVAPQRDFLLLGTAAGDTSTDVIQFKPLVALGKQVTGSNHPSVWSLTPADGAPSRLPGVAPQDSDNGTIQVLYFKANIGAAGSAKPTTMGLVVVGTSSAA